MGVVVRGGSLGFGDVFYLFFFVLMDFDSFDLSERFMNGIYNIINEI
jgi:hypothetical protein